MKRALWEKTASLATIVFLLLFLTSIASARTTAKEEARLTDEISKIDSYAAMPRGDAVVMDRVAKTFKLTTDKITALRDKKLGYGDIAAVYALADKMPGGVTDDNVSKVISLREGRTGWGTIAKDLKVDLGKVAGKVKDIEKDAGHDIKKASSDATRDATHGSGAGGRGRAVR